MTSPAIAPQNSSQNSSQSSSQNFSQIDAQLLTVQQDPSEHLPFEQFDQCGPIHLVVIQGTSLCNLNCDYCYLPDRQSKNQISLELIQQIAEQVRTSQFLGKCVTFCWHAGEPLTLPILFYENAFEIINQTSHRIRTETNRPPCRMSHSIQTNGTLINQAWCDLIKRHHIKIGVSVDGPNFIHDRHRKDWSGAGTFAKTLRGMKLLSQNKIDFHTITVLTREALDYPDELFNFFIENGIKRVGFNVEEIEGINQETSLSNQGAEEHYRAFMQRFWELTKETKGALKVREFERVCGLMYTGQRITRGQMTTPFAIISIDHQGNFSTFSPELLAMKDTYYGDFILGNIQHNSFESVCQTAKFQQMFNDIRAGVDRCQSTCQYFGVCGGGAPSNKYWENQSFRTAETRSCRLYKQIVTDIILEDFEKTLGIPAAQSHPSTLQS